MIVQPVANDYQLAMILDSVVLDGARSAHDVAVCTGLRLPLIWAGIVALANAGLLRTSLHNPGDLHASNVGVAAVRHRLAELNERWLADADPLPEPA